jgi:DNA-binding LytR/AlgR family response regulator
MKFKLIIDNSREEEVVATVHARSALTDAIEALILQSSGTDRLTVYTEDEILQLPFAQIACITVLGGKTYAISADGNRYRLKQRLYELEAIVPACFIRINKSALANEHQLERFSAAFSGGVDAVFRCGHTEYVSRRCFAAIKRRFENR